MTCSIVHARAMSRLAKARRSVGEWTRKRSSFRVMVASTLRVKRAGDGAHGVGHLGVLRDDQRGAQLLRGVHRQRARRRADGDQRIGEMRVEGETMDIGMVGEHIEQRAVRRAMREIRHGAVLADEAMHEVQGQPVGKGIENERGQFRHRHLRALGE